MSSKTHPEEKPARAFATTRWSVVLSAADRSAPPDTPALAVLCETYWHPLYVFARRRGADPEQAQDLTQGFFARLLEKRDFSTADPQRGRFRTYLLAAFTHYMNNEHARSRAIKRGGECKFLPLDFSSTELSFSREATAVSDPEKAYNRRWVLALLDKVLTRLEQEAQSRGKEEHFSHLKPFLTADGSDLSFPALSVQLGMSESALKVAVYRLRRRYRDLLQQAVSDTLEDPAQVQEEIQFLLKSLSA